MEEMAGASEGEARRGTLKVFQRGIGKLLLVAAGMGAVVLLMFVVVPMLTAPVPEPLPLAPEEIVAEVLSEPGGEAEYEAAEDLPAVPTPLVALRENGDELPVVFPATHEEPGLADDRPATDGAAPEAALPPVLTPEEIETAVVVPVAPEVTAAKEAPAAEPDQVPAALPQGLGNPDRTVFQALRESRPAGLTLPPSAATREVQELLESLGYEPGPVDGVWGDRTERAWKRFSLAASEQESRSDFPQALPMVAETAAAPSKAEQPAAPSGGTGAETAHGAGQDGPPEAGLPLPETVTASERVRVPGTLRGVMGYRLPLVSRQEVPDQVVSGVLIPAHTTFVILRGGEWELTGLEPHEVKRMDAAAEAAAAAPPETAPPRRRWNPLRLLRRQPPPADGE